jgi:hypothetical protein
MKRLQTIKYNIDERGGNNEYKHFEDNMRL